MYHRQFLHNTGMCNHHRTLTYVSQYTAYITVYIVVEKQSLLILVANNRILLRGSRRYGIRTYEVGQPVHSVIYVLREVHVRYRSVYTHLKRKWSCYVIHVVVYVMSGILLYAYSDNFLRKGTFYVKHLWKQHPARE